MFTEIPITYKGEPYIVHGDGRVEPLKADLQVLVTEALTYGDECGPEARIRAALGDDGTAGKAVLVEGLGYPGQPDPFNPQ